jgi:tetratricopeptide (TPR) repeat protein
VLPSHTIIQVPAARAECALGKGDLEVARAAWEEALLGPDLGLANLRLGDLALLDGDVVLAMNHYAKVIPVGPVGRLAQARTCELAGNCFSEVESKRIASDEGLAPEFARELALYTLRRELVSGRDRAALEFMTKRLSMDPDLCEAARTFCQKVVEVGLGSADVEARIAGLSLYLNDRVRRGPREQALNRVASETAFELGAPAFAAAVLASNTPHVEASALPSHLLRIIKLYTAANDHVRAEVILEYADTKLGAVTRGAEWSAVRKQLRSNAKTKRAVELPSLAADEQALEALTSQVTLTTDLARAARARSQAVENQRETP